MRLIKLSNQTMVNPEKIEEVSVTTFSDGSFNVTIFTSSTGIVFTKKFSAWEGEDTKLFKPYIDYLVKTGIEDDTFQKTLSIIESKETLVKWLTNQIYLTVSNTVEHMIDKISPNICKKSVVQLNETDIYIVFHNFNSITAGDLHEMISKDNIFTYTIDSMEGIYNIKIAKEERLEDLTITENYNNVIASTVKQKVIENYKY